MPTPQFAFRLPADKARKLRAVAKIYGSNPSEFLRQLVGTIVEADKPQAQRFQQDLQAALFRNLQEREQATLFEPPVGAKEPRKPAKKARSAGKG